MRYQNRYSKHQNHDLDPPKPPITKWDKLVQSIEMINVVAFETQKHYKYTFLVSVPFFLIFGNIIRILSKDRDIAFIGIFACEIILFLITNLFLGQKVKKDKIKYGTAIKDYPFLQTEVIGLIIGIVLISLSILGLFYLHDLNFKGAIH